MNSAFPFHFDACGHTAQVNEEDHIRDMIEQVLFTVPGERVNRPSFGSGLMQLVFAPNSEELSVSARFLVESSLQQWLGDRIQINEVKVESNDSTISATVQYIILKTGKQQIRQFTRKL